LRGRSGGCHCIFILRAGRISERHNRIQFALPISYAGVGR
jgi:hypothetical protein